MARITPPAQQNDLSELKDYEPYRAHIHKIDWQESSAEYGGESRLVIDWALDDHDPLTIRDWVSLRLGRQQSGQVSKLRKILNAIGQQPEAKDIAWFDDETLEWSYDGNKPYAKLDVGLPAIIRGQTVEKPSENGPKRRFVIQAYQPAGIAQTAQPRQTRERPQVVKNVDRSPDDDEEIPF